MMIKFIQPILDGTEDEEEYLKKAKIGMIAWNYIICDKFQLPIDSEYKKILNDVTKTHAEAKRVLNSLVLRKQMEFSEYDQLIASVEIKTKPDGSKTLFVLSGPADKLFS